MSNRIDEMFARARGEKQGALIPYLTSGFPSPEHTVSLLSALDSGGADLIELGVPFSDPIADGPTIQRASSEALEAGATLASTIESVRSFRKSSQTPLILFGAYNPFFHYGLERLADDAAAAGADGLLIPDVPAEEADEVRPILEARGLHLILLIAPTTPLERKRDICSNAKGFLYYISLKGVTGARSSFTFELQQPISEIRSCTDLPVAVGFGIGTPEQAAAVSSIADGVVVGSALIDLISKNRDKTDLPAIVTQFIRSMKQALRGIPSSASAA
jgi:tryptophan synthase alpha chain